MDKNKDDSLLVIRLSAMGDVAMTVPALLSLTRLNPKLRLQVLTRPFFSPIFRDIPNTEVFSADLKEQYKGLQGIFKLSKDLKKNGYAGVADLHNVLRTKILRMFLSGWGVPFVQLDKGRREKKKLTRWGVKDIGLLKSTHERYADVFRKMGYPVVLDPRDILPRRSLVKIADQFLAKGDNKLIGIAPFAAFQGKMYPMELMEKVLLHLNDTNKYNIILFGGGAMEIKELQRLEARYPHCISAAGRLTFEQELDLISNLQLMVSMDSGNGHLAALFGVPVITLWGITHPFAGFAPFGQHASHQILADRDLYPMIPTSVYGNKFPKGYEMVMESIDPRIVIEKIHSVLEE